MMLSLLLQVLNGNIRQKAFPKLGDALSQSRFGAPSFVSFLAIPLLSASINPFRNPPFHSFVLLLRCLIIVVSAGSASGQY